MGCPSKCLTSAQIAAKRRKPLLSHGGKKYKINVIEILLLTIASSRNAETPAWEFNPTSNPPRATRRTQPHSPDPNSEIHKKPKHQTYGRLSLLLISLFRMKLNKFWSSERFTYFHSFFQLPKFCTDFEQKWSNFFVVFCARDTSHLLPFCSLIVLFVFCFHFSFSRFHLCHSVFES